MTPDERRQFLESRGFKPAGRSFDGGATFSMVDMEETRKLPGGKRPIYFIDLHSGRWQLSGKPFQDWSTGPWHELADEVPGAAAPVAPSPAAEPRPLVIAPEFAPDGRKVLRCFQESDLQFFADCVAAGFEIVEPAPRLLDGIKDLGNREGRRNGIGYTLMCRTKSIMGPGCQIFKLHDFTGAAPTQQTVQQTAPKIVPPVNRPVFSEVKVKVEMAGNTKQKGLFV